MSEKSLYCKKELLCGDGESACLNYYLLKEGEQYGILVAMQRGGNMEQVRAKGLTVHAEKIERLLELMSRNSVTPCALEEILRDLGNKF